jgi:predicted Zn-dependent protease
MTHPLTSERIADIENRIQSMPYRQVPDSLDFLLVRAKIKATEGAAQDAVAEFTAQVQERKFSSEIAARYGLAVAQLRALNYRGSEQQLEELRRLKAASPMIEGLAARVRLAQKDPAGALKILRAALVLYPQQRALSYALVDALLANGEREAALAATVDDLQMHPSDLRMHGDQAKIYALLGKRFATHRAQAETYVLQGQLLAAIEQLQLAQKSDDGDFYGHSVVDARLRELKVRQVKEAKDAKQ